MSTRREFLGVSGLGLAAVTVAGAKPGPTRLKPRRLRAGDTVGLVSPASATFLREELAVVEETIAALGLQLKLGPHLMDRRGYFAGADADRAADINGFFADASVAAVICVRGGWGSARVLKYLDYEAIRKNPKVLLGFSDITALHTALLARTGLVTFHGPTAGSRWTSFSADHFRRVVFDAEAPLLENLKDKGDLLAQEEDRTLTIHPGVARGSLLGGNLTVLSALMGSEYLPDYNGAILFLEDVNEDLYRIDRMLTTLALAGVLSRIRGFVFGRCTECDPGEGYGSLTLEEILADHIKPLGIPAFQGAMIGHIDNQFTLPIGVEAEIDAAKGSIRLLEPGVL